jgi:putative heme transporter
VTTFSVTRRAVLHSARISLAVAAVALLFVVAIPGVSGIPWAQVAEAVRRVPAADLVALAALWATGLLLHTFTLTAALPRLTHRRALALSLTGSAISNVLPFGGAAGIALNYRMVRDWGFEPAAFATYTVVTNVWDVLAKLCLPAVALGWLLMSGGTAAAGMVGTTVTATGLLALFSLALALVLVSPRATARVGAVLDRVLAAALRVLGSRRDPRCAERLIRARAQCASVVRHGWPRLTLGMASYTVSLAALLWFCLHLTGAGLPPAAVFAGFALERVLTIAGLTPGGAGVVEVGVSGLLLVLGGDPLGVVTGVLLYRLFTYGLEIPVGGLGLAAWLWMRRRQRRLPVGGAS